MYGVMAEVFEDDLVAFLPRIFKNLEKVIHYEGTMRLHGAISETLGNLVFTLTEKIPNQFDQRDFFEK